MNHQTKAGNRVTRHLSSLTHPNLKRASEVIQISLNEADVLQPELCTATLGPDQGLFFVLYEDDLEQRQSYM